MVSFFPSKRKHTIDLSIHKTTYMNMKKKTQIRVIYDDPSEEFPDDSGVEGASMAGRATRLGLAGPAFEGLAPMSIFFLVIFESTSYSAPFFFFTDAMSLNESGLPALSSFKSYLANASI
jgi:hypothetical protein